MSRLQVQEQRLPGIGWRFETPVGDDRRHTLVIVVEDRGPRHLMVFDEDGQELVANVRLSPHHAAGVAALLTGARLAVSPAPAQGAVSSGRPGGREVGEPP